MKKVLPLFCAVLALFFVSCASTKQVADDDISKSQAVHVDDEEEKQEETPAPEPAPVEASDVQNSLEAAESARQAAIEAGAKDSYADAFGLTDAAFEALKKLDDGKNHSAEYAEIKARFDALAAAAKAKKLKERIDQEGLAQYAKADYDAGEKALAEFDAMAAAPLTPGAALNQKASEAYNDYYAVYFKSYKKLAADERKNAIAQKRAADAVKAQVARKSEYASGIELIKKGDSNFATQNPEAAYNSYKEASQSLEALAKDVAAKRAEAQKAIEEAKAKVKASSEYAEKADIEKPLGDEPVAGIESEDTVLLKQDDFANPDEQIIQIQESIIINGGNPDEQIIQKQESVIIDAGE